jgi:cytochrome c-type biogenesis protein CcmE
MNRKGSPARLVVALSIAGTLAVFLLYTALAGGATPTIQPSALDGQHGVVELSGVVTGPVAGDPQGAGMRFGLRDDKGPGRVRVVYHGAVPDLFARGRHVLVRGQLQGAVFVAVRDSLVTKCPSKYVPKKSRA